jgi:hypothetical protein
MVFGSPAQLTVESDYESVREVYLGEAGDASVRLGDEYYLSFTLAL